MTTTPPITSTVVVAPPHDADRLLREGAIKSSPPPVRVYPMHNETTNIAIRKEFRENRRRASVKIRSAELYNQADILDQFASHLEAFVTGGRHLLQATDLEDREALKELILSHLEQIEDGLREFRSAEVRLKDELLEPDKEFAARREPDPLGLRGDIQRLKARLQGHQQTSQTAPNPPPEEDSGPASPGAWLKVIEDHRSRLRDIEAVLRDKARKAIRILEDAMDKESLEDFSRTLQEIQGARNDIALIKSSYQVPRKGGARGTVDDDEQDAKHLPARPDQVAEALVRNAPRHQVIRTHELLSEAVGDLVF